MLSRSSLAHRRIGKRVDEPNRRGWFFRRLQVERLEERNLLAVSIFASEEGSLYLDDTPSSVADSNVEVKGVVETQETDAPSEGDGNGDGVLDSEQEHVVSVQSHDDDPSVTLVAPEEMRLEDVKTTDNPSPDDAPPDVEFPVGFFDFRVADVALGGSATVTVHLEPGTQADTYYMFGPTPEDPNPHWYPFIHDGTTGAKVYSDRIELTFVDGQRGDDDLTVNGVIVDPGGPGVSKLPWQNSVRPENVDNDGGVTPRDVLILINEINTRGPRHLPPTPDGMGVSPPYLDVSGDNAITALDVLKVIEYLNRQAVGANNTARDASAPDLSAGPVSGPLLDPPSRQSTQSRMNRSQQNSSERRSISAPSDLEEDAVPSGSQQNHRGSDAVIETESWREDVSSLMETISEIAEDISSAW